MIPSDWRWWVLLVPTLIGTVLFKYVGWAALAVSVPLIAVFVVGLKVCDRRYGVDHRRRGRTPPGAIS